MARKTIAAQFLPADDDEIDVFEVRQENETGKTTAEVKYDDLVSSLNDTSDDSEVILYRQNGSGKTKMTFLESFPVDQYAYSELLKYVRDSYGAGDYRVHIRSNKRLVANRLISIEMPKGPTIQSLSPAGEAASILQTVLDRQEKMHQQMMDLMSRQNEPQSRMDMLQEMLLFKQLFDNGSNARDPVQQMRETLGLLTDMGMEIGGIKKDDEPGFGDLLEKMTPLLTAAVSQPQRHNVRNDPMFAQKLALKTGVAQLLRAAAKGSAREPYAELVLDQVSEEMVKDFITSPDAMEKMIKLEPKTAHYRAWFLDLAEHVKAALGMPSQYADLYTGEDDAITAGNDPDIDEGNGTDNV